MPEISTGHQQRKCRFDSGSFVEAWQEGGRFDSVIGRWATKDMTPRKDGGQHRSPPGLSMRHPSADGRNDGKEAAHRARCDGYERTAKAAGHEKDLYVTQRYRDDAERRKREAEAQHFSECYGVR